MQRYKAHQPTQYDSRGLCGDTHGIAEFMVLPCQRNRDSNAIDESNFASALTLLGGESETVQVHRFGHWACGWYELILIDPSDAKALSVAETIEARLEDYPMLNEDDVSNREYEEACETWRTNGIRYRMEMCKRARISIFAARRDDLSTVPDDSGALQQLLTGN